MLLVHLMSAGRLRYLTFGEKRPETPAFRLQFQGGAELILTEAGKKKPAGAWLWSPEAAEAELATSGPRRMSSAPSNSARSSRASRAAGTCSCETSG